MCNVHLILSTVDSVQVAEEIAHRVIEEHLAACVNLLPGVSSYYRWQGAIQREQECMLILKTSTDRLQELMERVKSLHPYEVPEILSIPVEQGYSSYLQWVREETKA